MIEVLLSGFAVWKITESIMNYSGPFNSLHYLRLLIRYLRLDDKLLNIDCFFCLSTIIALPFGIYLGSNWSILIYWFGISGLAFLLQSIIFSLEK